MLFAKTFDPPETENLARRSLVDYLLREQQHTAVERFSEWHECEDSSPPAARYRDLIPLSKPAEGEQYAFEVDLDACSGCKACVTACHSLNGLEPAETWRSVGLLHGGSRELPILQHVTTACHHCLEPACLEGCPVEAYEKDPVTGIVRHLDDQCFGCQYCILKCPYDVPKYSSRLGIVRKCDMCRHRLSAGEAPACVQACPNQAIRIMLVNRLEVAESAEANFFLPGAPEPRLTLPTTVYKTRGALPANLLPADYYSATPQHAHWPLVLMLVFTQMSVGAFVSDAILGAALSTSGDSTGVARAVHLAAAFILGIVGLGASVFHLGRPWLAYRAVIGWRKSWLSREAIAFGLFAASASCYAAAPWLAALGIPLSPLVERALATLVGLSGMVGVFCSVMIYASTKRPYWNAGYTGLKFALSCQLLGLPVALLIRLSAAAISGSESVDQVMESSVPVFAWLLLAGVLKLAAEGSVFLWLPARHLSPLKRTALLLTGELGPIALQRFVLGAAGGVVLPGALLACYAPADGAALSPLFAVLMVLLTLAACLAGEILERYLFFAAVVAPKMPGAPAT
jgi:formate dehydrogenase iron-sulfur subunit